MSYASIDDVFARYRPINTLVGSGVNQVTSTDVSSVFIAGAEGIIDAYAGRRYTLPLPGNYLITRIAADIAIFDMLVEHLPQVPDFMEKRYERSMELLREISSGTLVVASATVLTEGATDQEAWSSTNSSYHTIFSPVLGELDQAADSNRVTEDYGQRSDDYNQ